MQQLPQFLWDLPRSLFPHVSSTHRRDIQHVARASRILPSDSDRRDAVIDNILHTFRPVDIQGGGAVDLAPFTPEPIDDQGQTAICVSESTTAMKSCQDQCGTLNPYMIYAFRQDTLGDNGMSIKEAMRIWYKRGGYTYEEQPYRQVFLDRGGQVTPEERRFPAGSLGPSRHKIQAYGRVYSLNVALTLLKLAEMYCLRADKGRPSVADGSRGFNIGCLPCILPVYDGPPETFWEKAVPKSDKANRGLWHADVHYQAGDCVLKKDQWWQAVDVPDTAAAAAARKATAAHAPAASGSLVWRLVPGQRRVGYHSVAIVGFNPQTRLLKLRNSWSLDFDDRGHFYVPFSAWSSVVECWFGTDDAVLAKLITDQIQAHAEFHMTNDGEERAGN